MTTLCTISILLVLTEAARVTRLAWRVVPITCDVMPYSPAAHTPGVAHGPPLPGVAGTDCCAYMPHSSATLCRPAHQVSAGSWSAALGPAGGRQACRQAGGLGGGQYIRCKQAGGRPGVSRQELCSPWICRVGAVWGRSGPGLWSEVWGRG